MTADARVELGVSGSINTTQQEDLRGVEMQVCRSLVCWMMGFFKISRISISIVFKISINPIVKVEVPQSFKTWTAAPPNPAAHSELLHFSTDMPGHR